MNLMLDLQIIREDVTPTIPPTVEKISSFKFTPGEKRTLAIQVLNGYNKRPYVLPVGWQADIELKTLDPDVPLQKSMTVDALDRSVLTVDLSDVETESLISGKIKLIISETIDPTNKMIVLKDGLFTKIKEDCGC